MTANTLTDAQLRAWIKVGIPLARADRSGLTFTLSAAGTAAWVSRYRFGGAPRELTLGRYPDLSLAAARKLESVQKLLSQNQGLINVGARLRAIGQVIAGKPAPTINKLVFRQFLSSSASRPHSARRRRSPSQAPEKQASATAWTFAQLAQDCKVKVFPPLAASTREQCERHLALACQRLEAFLDSL